MARVWALLLLGTRAASLLPEEVELPDFSKLEPDSIYFFKLGDQKCGKGTDLYYGVVLPPKITTTNRYWIESMGGAVCFNEGSCADREFGVWLDLLSVIARYAGSTASMFGGSENLFRMLSSGQAVGMSLFRGLEAAYHPSQEGAALEGEVGLYFPSCTGDAGLGNYDVQYDSSTDTRHGGAVSYMVMLQALKRKNANLERLTLIGASGSAVSRVAWAPTVADLFPSTQINVLADSAMHILPSTEAFNYFWENVQWSPNPSGKHDQAKIYAPEVASLPTFDWRKQSWTSDMLRQYNGRIKVLYLACDKDSVAFSDRSGLSAYANLTINTTVDEEMWDFLQRLTRDAPAGTVYTYVSQGTCHHQTRSGFMAANAGAVVGPKEFTEQFLKGETPVNAHLWCCNKTPSESAYELSRAAGAAPSLALLALATTAAALLAAF